MNLAPRLVAAVSLLLMPVVGGCATPDPGEPAAPSAPPTSSRAAPIDRAVGSPTAGAERFEPDYERVATLFVAFASGQLSGPPVDTPVDLYLDNGFVKTITASRSDEPVAYDLCAAEQPEPCRTSAVSVIRRQGADAVRTGGALGRCLSDQPPLPTQVPPFSISIRPAGEGDCAADFAVQLRINDVSQIVGVNLLLAREG